MVVLGALSVIGFITGIVLIILEKNKNKEYHGKLIAATSIVYLMIAIINMENVSLTTLSKSAQTESQIVSWQDKIAEIAAADGTPFEKFNKISLYAKQYKPKKNEIKQFEEYIIQEYKAKNYLKDTANETYILENTFKSQVVDQYYEPGEPMKDFAFNFWQNTKYTYQGIHTPTSPVILANEGQMDMILEKMGK